MTMVQIPREVWAQHRCRELLTSGFPLTEELVRLILEAVDALWLHDGDESKPHVELTIKGPADGREHGDCSDGYVNMSQAFSYPEVCAAFARGAVDRLREDYPGIVGAVKWVVGSSYASITFAHEVAKLLCARVGFTEKQPDGTQAWRRGVIKPGELVLQAEELVTTTGTMRLVRKGIVAAHNHEIAFAPVSLAAIHRSAQLEFEGGPIVYLVHFDIHTWPREDCPLCKKGSTPLLAKSHWAQLSRFS